MRIKALALLFIKVVLVYIVSAQKKTLDNDDYKTWTALQQIGWDNSGERRSCVVSGDGKYVAYKYGAPATEDFVVVQSLNGKYKREFNIGQGDEVLFTSDSRRFIAKLAGDSLVVLTMENDHIEFIADVISFAVPHDNGGWLASYNSKNELCIRSFIGHVAMKYRNVTNYNFDARGTQMLVTTTEALILSNLGRKKDTHLASGVKVVNTSVHDGVSPLEDSFSQIAFVVNTGSGIEIRYYTAGMDSTKVLLHNETAGMPGDLELSDEEGYSGRLWFNQDGTSLFFHLKQKEYKSKKVLPAALTRDVEIRRSADGFVSYDPVGAKYDPLVNPRPGGGYLAVCNINKPRVILLKDPSMGVGAWFTSAKVKNYLLLNSWSNWDASEAHARNERQSVYVVSIKDGIRKEVCGLRAAGLTLCIISPDERYVVWFDDEEKVYRSYEINTGYTTNISGLLNTVLYDDQSDIEERRSPFGVAGWLNESTMLVYDRYDIWKIDAAGKKIPVCLTQGSGRKNRIIFRRACSEKEQFRRVYDKKILLAAWNATTKENGFWNLDLSKQSVPEKLTMADCVYYFPRPCQNILIAPSEYLPVKAGKADVYLVRTMRADQSPNLSVTRDFRTFKALTNIYPEKKVNWLSSEIVTWKLSDTVNAEGILYKPLNFDAGKKYPLIFYYYEKLSDALNIYYPPVPSIGTLSIPWYVSNGYLVFVPDMHYEKERVAESIVHSVISAVKKLSQYSFIDTSRMGLQGHSFGGFETLTLICHTKLFAAAQESAGPANSTSYYNQPTGIVDNRNIYYDIGQGNIGYPVWERPDLYIKNSPIFHVQNVTTPLLMMHNDRDDNVPFYQAIEMFTALRRAQKRVWFVQYKGDNHILLKPENQLDFTIRQQEFFDHYLKGMPAPPWMTEFRPLYK